MRTYDNIRKIVTGQGDDYVNVCLIDQPDFKNSYVIIPTDLGKQQALDVDPKAIKQTNFTGNLNQRARAIIFFIIKEAKETIVDFSQETLKDL